MKRSVYHGLVLLHMYLLHGKMKWQNLESRRNGTTAQENQHVHTRACTCIHTHTTAHKHTHTLIHVDVQMHAHTLYMYTNMHTYRYTCSHTHLPLKGDSRTGAGLEASKIFFAYLDRAVP